MSGARLLKANPPPDTSIDYSSAIGEFAIGLSPIEGWVPAFAPDTDPDAEFARSVRSDIARFLNTVQTRVAGITLPVIELELANVVEEFCYRSTYFRNKVYWQLAQGMSQLSITPYDGRMETIYILDQEGLTDYYVDPPATIVDTMAPNASRTGWALIAIKPRSWEDVEQGAVPVLFRNWFEVMLDGLLFRLYGMPSRPWSSSQLASYHGTRWWQGVNRARDQAERLNTNRQSPFRFYPYFARGRRKQ
jgi:hypothetical protein